MVSHVIIKENSRLRFIYWHNKFLDVPLSRLLCKEYNLSFIKHVTVGNLNKNLEMVLQSAQNKCIRFYLKLGRQIRF